MGLFDGRSYSDSERLRAQSSSSRRGASYSRGYSPSRSSTGNAYYARTTSSSYGKSRGPFSPSGGGGSSSYYRRRPRDGYISYLVQKLQRMIKELWQYAKRHPLRAFFAVILPLLSAGGAIHGLIRQLGLKMPSLDGSTKRFSGGYYGSAGYGGVKGAGEGGWMDSAGSLAQIAKAFL